MELIDSHCHFDDRRFDPDRAQAWQRARSVGVGALVIPGIKAERWPRVREVCRENPAFYPAYGMHPMFMREHQPGDLEQLARWLDREPAVAVGECGLDYYIDNPQREAQQALFQAQLDVASERRLPVIIHARRAVEDSIRILKGYPTLRGVLHSFSGSEQQARQLIGMGFLLSFGGPVTYPRASRLRRTLARLPLSGLMLESDAPDQPDLDIRGQRNEPARVARVLETLVELRSESSAEIAATTSENARALFGLATHG